METTPLLPGITLIFVATGLAIAAIALPLWAGRVPPNRWYGFRTRKTLKNSQVWYWANAYGGRLMVGSGIITALGALCLRGLPWLTRDASSYEMACALVLIGTSVWVTVRSLAYIRTL
jgi:uncharacterized membrane protein